MKRTVIITHANLAEGFVSALKLIVGNVENMYFINSFTDSLHPEDDFLELINSFDDEDTVVVMTDLKGGSVNQFVTRIAREKGFLLITGINLGLVLEIALADESMLSKEAIREKISNCKEDMTLMNDMFSAMNEEVHDEEDFFG